MRNPLKAAIKIVGLSQLARSLNITPQRLKHWVEKGLPRSEWTKETNYAVRISNVIHNVTYGDKHYYISADDLLGWSLQQRKRTKRLTGG